MMRRVMAVFLFVLLMTGCTNSTPSETESLDIVSDEPTMITLNTVDITPSEAIDIPSNIMETFPGEIVNTESDAPEAPPVETDNASPDSIERKDYYELKAEFEKEIEKAIQKDEIGYAWGIMQVFEEMLNYRESLEDINKELGSFYSKSDDFKMWIYEAAVFSAGNTNYRVLMFGAWNIPLDGLYIQVYNDEYVESYKLRQYVHEGGTYDSMLYCGFIQETNKNYLVIIDKTYHEASDDTTYTLVNYEINGKDINNYTALKEDVSTGVWTVKEIYDESYNTTSVRISFSHVALWPDSWWDPGYDSEESFSGNAFTIFLNNQGKDEVTLLFSDGFWEILAIRDDEVTDEHAMYLSYLEQYKTTAYKIFDFDGDGVLDLWFEAEENDDIQTQNRIITGLCTIANRKVELLLYGNGGWNAGGNYVTVMKNKETSANVIVFVDSLGGYDSGIRVTRQRFYAMKNGGLSELETLRYTYRWATEQMGAESIYEVDGVYVSKEIYEKTANTYTNPMIAYYF